MVTTDRVNFLFADARSLYDDAIEMLDQGTVRNAAEKAWEATKRATCALVLARHGEEPQSAGQARRALLRLSGQDTAFDAFQGQYNTRAGAPACQLLLRRQLRTGAGDGRPDTGHHHVHPDPGAHSKTSPGRHERTE